MDISSLLSPVSNFQKAARVKPVRSHFIQPARGMDAVPLPGNLSFGLRGSLKRGPVEALHQHTPIHKISRGSKDRHTNSGDRRATPQTQHGGSGRLGHAGLRNAVNAASAFPGNPVAYPGNIFHTPGNGQALPTGPITSPACSTPLAYIPYSSGNADLVGGAQSSPGFASLPATSFVPGDDRTRSVNAPSKVLCWVSLTEVLLQSVGNDCFEMIAFLHFRNRMPGKWELKTFSV